MSIQTKFQKLVSHSKFNILDYIFLCSKDDLSKFQQSIIEPATSILEANRDGEIQYFGGNVEKDKESFGAVKEGLKNELQKEEYKEDQKELGKLLQKYMKVLAKFIDKTCYAIIPVREMPWEHVLFRTVPKIVIEDNKVRLIDNIFSYYGEIKKHISKDIIYGTIKNEDPLFAPVMGDLDLNYEAGESHEKSKKSFNFAYISAILNSLEESSLKSHLARYHEGYERRGEPICDFLMKNTGVMNAMKELVTGIDSGRLSGEMAVCGIIHPQKSDKTTLILVTSEGDELNTYETCFEAVFRLSAACFNAPSAEIERAPGGNLNQIPQQTSGQQGGPVRTPGGQELNVWTPEELADERQSRQGNLPEGMEVWSPEELAEHAKSRQANLPEGMEMWKEDELEELSKKRQGGLDIPEWKPDEEMRECKKCGYNLRKSWSKCPVCGTVIGSEEKGNADKN